MKIAVAANDLLEVVVAPAVERHGLLPAQRPHLVVERAHLVLEARGRRGEQLPLAVERHRERHVGMVAAPARDVGRLRQQGFSRVVDLARGQQTDVEGPDRPQPQRD